MSEIFESKPRWPGAPRICIYENLLAFTNEKEMKTFNSNNGGQSIIEFWQCKVCGCFYHFAAPTPPAGQTSGTGRAYPVPVPRFRREALEKQRKEIKNEDF